VDGIKTFYIKEGSGHPLLLIHGGAPGACSLVTWKPNIAYFAASGFTVYAFDQPGYGYTDNPKDYSLEYRAAHAKSFIDKLGLDRFHMIAQSRGGVGLGEEDGCPRCDTNPGTNRCVAARIGRSPCTVL